MALRFPSPYILPFSWATISHLLLFPNVHRVLHSHLTHSQKQGTPTNCPAPTLCPPQVHALPPRPHGGRPLKASTRNSCLLKHISLAAVSSLLHHKGCLLRAIAPVCMQVCCNNLIIQRKKNHFDSTSCLLHLLPRVLTTCITKILSDLPYLRFQFFSSHFSPEPAPIMLLTFTLLGH